MIKTNADACGSNDGDNSFSSSDNSYGSFGNVILEISNSIISRDKPAANKLGFNYSIISRFFFFLKKIINIRYSNRMNV